jgi:hypothetical protein
MSCPIYRHSSCVPRLHGAALRPRAPRARRAAPVAGVGGAAGGVGRGAAVGGFHRGGNSQIHKWAILVLKPIVFWAPGL